MWKTCIAFNSDLLDQMNDICKDIAKKDETFRFRIRKTSRTLGYEPKFDYVLTILSEDKDKAHKRGTLFVKRYFEGRNLLYWVRE